MFQYRLFDCYCIRYLYFIHVSIYRTTRVLVFLTTLFTIANCAHKNFQWNTRVSAESVKIVSPNIWKRYSPIIPYAAILHHYITASERKSVRLLIIASKKENGPAGRLLETIVRRYFRRTTKMTFAKHDGTTDFAMPPLLCLRDARSARGIRYDIMANRKKQCSQKRNKEIE